MAAFRKEIYCTESIYSIKFTGTSYKIVPVTNLNKYLRHNTSEMEVNISASEKLFKKHRYLL